MSISEGKIPVQTVLLVSNVPANYDGIHVSQSIQNIIIHPM